MEIRADAKRMLLIVCGFRIGPQPRTVAARLHSLGLLAGSFLLSDTLQELRTYHYHRQHLIEQLATYTHKMQKSLRLMNVRVDVAIRDITRKSGLAIIEAILAGNRDPHYLASLVDVRMKNPKRKSLNLLTAGGDRSCFRFGLATGCELNRESDQS